ncbi:PREDICTED: putative nuclease HARBI1, partial [Rhagoletis zephyria]|uniref:putative nuclease HARBI1 n=1 Tax=Rhagoletis zephyria TaxID=28612 RepID=UPI0008119377
MQQWSHATLRNPPSLFNKIFGEPVFLRAWFIPEMCRKQLPNCDEPVAIHHISKLIMDVKGGEIRVPKTSNEVLEVKKGFYTAFKIKGTIGAVDCTHIGIVAPSSTDPSNPLCMYMNRKGFYSINVEAVCDHRLVFTAINARFPGSYHDS